jgi:hypothetical protein
MAAPQKQPHKRIVNAQNGGTWRPELSKDDYEPKWCIAHIV